MWRSNLATTPRRSSHTVEEDVVCGHVSNCNGSQVLEGVFPSPQFLPIYLECPRPIQCILPPLVVLCVENNSPSKYVIVGGDELKMEYIVSAFTPDVDQIILQ